MKILLIKLLLRLLSREVDSDRIDRGRMEEWLEGLVMPKSGFQDWYTLRKKSIMQGLSIGVEGKEYWTLFGRLLELKQLSKTAEMQFSKKKKV
jgi:hypothetical protein